MKRKERNRLKRWLKKSEAMKKLPSPVIIEKELKDGVDLTSLTSLADLAPKMLIGGDEMDAYSTFPSLIEGRYDGVDSAVDMSKFHKPKKEFRWNKKGEASEVSDRGVIENSALYPIAVGDARNRILLEIMDLLEGKPQTIDAALFDPDEESDFMKEVKKL